MQYSATQAIAGSSGEALRCVRDALIANGFEVLSATADEIAVAGPCQRNMRQNALRGISRATVRSRAGAITLDAELGGVLFLRRFVTLFPLGMALLLCVVMTLVFTLSGQAEGLRPALLAPLLAFSPWLVIGPILAHVIRKRTEGSIDALLRSAAAVSRSA